MKRILMGGLLIGLACNAFARKPSTQTEVFRPTTSVIVERPATKISGVRPTTSVEVFHETTHTEVFRPKTNVQVLHPTTQVQVIHPQTTVEVVHPQTNVVVFHPQTTVEVFRPQTLEVTDATNTEKAGGKQTSSQKTTSMSDFKPKEAKDLSAGNKPATEKAAKISNGSVSLGNDDSNQTEKDNVNKSSTLGAQKGASQNLDVDPTKNKATGLEKLITDRAKFKEKTQ